ncbi:MAG: hypothetical protein ABI867_30205 [Kofleriaceae bacterium]
MNRSSIEQFMWKPWVPFVVLLYFAWRCLANGVTTYRFIALVWMAVWFGLAIYNARSGGRVLRWIRSQSR